MTKFTDFQRRMWYWLTYFSVCRFYIDRDQQGSYMIKKAGGFRLFIYYAMWLNSTIKIIYLILTYRGYLIEIHFLDQMSIVDWFLCFSQLVQEVNMWYRKYPLYEVLYSNWKIQEDIFRKLGFPTEAQDRILNNDRSLVIMHSAIIFVGCGSLVVQFVAAPKYALNTYAVVPADNWLMAFLFGAHECLYIFHIWAHQASSIVLCEVFAVSYTHVIREMTTVLDSLIRQGRLVEHPVSSSQSDEHSTGKEDTSPFRNSYSPNNSAAKRHISADIHRKRHEDIFADTQSKIVMRYLDPTTKAAGTEYDITMLLSDYKKVMLGAEVFNRWAGRLQGGTTFSNYGQFVSDVFMMIQLLKEPETDMMSVFFFMEDACAGMIILFRMLILISRLYPTSVEFLELFRGYLRHDMPRKKYWRKYARTLHIVASKLGGYSTKPITVPNGINALLTYYIMAAMWQRPVDRRT